MNRAVLAAFLCSATAPAAMCELAPQMSPFGAGQWTTLEDTRVTSSRALAAPNSFTSEGMQLPDATVLLNDSTAGQPSVDETRAAASALPVTSTAPDHEPESGLR